MGNLCSTTNTPEIGESFSREQLEQWHIGNENFDIACYNKSIPVYESLSFQHILSQEWKEMSLTRDFSEYGPEATLRSKYFKALKQMIFKGIPNHLIRDVLLKLLCFDDDKSKSHYTFLVSLIEDIPDLLHLPRTLEPFFGRKDLSNVFLTRQGIFTAKRILFTLNCHLQDISICLILPRVVQLLLWYAREHEVYSIVVALLKENKKEDRLAPFFPYGLVEHSEVISNAMKLLELYTQTIVHMNMKVLLEDMIFNMLIGYIPACFYSQILCSFLAEGSEGMLKFTLSVVLQNFKQLNFLLNEVSDLDFLLRTARKLTRRETSMPTVIMETITMNIDLDRGESTLPSEDEISSYFQIFQGKSTILKSSSELAILCGLLPKLYLARKFCLSFSLENSGMDIGLFTFMFGATESGVLLLIESKKQRVFGFITDNLSSPVVSGLFINSEPRQFYSYSSPHELLILSDTQRGFQVISNNEIVFSVSPSLQDGETQESVAFSSSKLYKQSHFQIYKLELYHLI